MPTNINLKMGGVTLPTSTSAGTVYFAKTTTYNNKNFGELYYDDSGEARVKIAPKLSSVTFNTGTATNPEFYINVEDGSKITASMPVAGESQWGVITTSSQTFAGAKTFSNTTASSSTTTGAVIIKGGVGIGGNIHVGGSSVFGGNLTINKGNLIVNDGEIKIGTSTEYCTLSYSTDTNTLTILFPE